MTLGDALARVQALGYSSSTAEAVIIRRDIIDASKRVFNRRRWPWRTAQVTSTLSSGGTTVTLPSDFADADALRLRDGVTYLNVRYSSPQALRTKAEAYDSNLTGPPELWAYADGTLTVWPAADKAYTAILDYVKKHVALNTDGTSDATELPGPEIFHQVVIWLAAVPMAHRERQLASAQAYAQEAATLMHELVATTGLRQRQSPSRVVRSGFYDDDLVP